MDKQSSLFQRSKYNADKSYITLTLGVGIIKCFTAVVDNKKVECLSLSVTVSIDLYLLARLESYPQGGPLG